MMDTYITTHTVTGDRWDVVRTTDWQVIATCANNTLADQVAVALNATV